MNIKKSLENRIRGWLPKEPMPSGKHASNSSYPDEEKQAKNNRPFLWRRFILIFLFAIAFGVLWLIQGEYVYAASFFVLAIVLTATIYLLTKYQIQIRTRTALGVPLIGLGIVTLFYSELATMFFSLAIVLFWLAISIARILAFWIIIGVLVGLVVLARSNVGKSLRRNLNRRLLLPYGVAALFVLLSVLAVLSGVQFAYAIPIAIIVSGVLVLKGLRRFTVTIPALVVLLISIIIFSSAVAGTYTVYYIPEDRFLTTAQASNVDTVNLTVKSNEGDIKLYFANDSAQICHVAFIKEYGPIIGSRVTTYHSKSAYDTEPASSFNYTVENNELTVTTRSYTTLVNITLNQNLKYNLNFYNYFGDIIIQVPAGVNSIQSTNLTSQYGQVEIIHTTSP